MCERVPLTTFLAHVLKNFAARGNDYELITVPHTTRGGIATCKVVMASGDLLVAGAHQEKKEILPSPPPDCLSKVILATPLYVILPTTKSPSSRSEREGIITRCDLLTISLFLPLRPM